ncbi:hypothetical protein B1B04_07170 [Lysinibacillus sp. KCTC 33748]|uniref:hypothetical protein n=1 Tax=unclassified Lysinibacillus TaxID=2636778 RepID=UPI0009A62EB5|nr:MULTISPECIES: hypothetical protein [unclassified Lysinibacillus]OXS75490.1 hypothetical protein B1B04_07170 [Lysinibacillus sp. KCTC 33748]SKB54122.1 hypothetical protein SAMN06295926_103299 [Lysinibacillus sp. AC-3]
MKKNNVYKVIIAILTSIIVMGIIAIWYLFSTDSFPTKIKQESLSSKGEIAKVVESEEVEAVEMIHEPATEKSCLSPENAITLDEMYANYLAFKRVALNEGGSLNFDNAINAFNGITKNLGTSFLMTRSTAYDKEVYKVVNEWAEDASNVSEDMLGFIQGTLEVNDSNLNIFRASFDDLDIFYGNKQKWENCQ